MISMLSDVDLVLQICSLLDLADARVTQAGGWASLEALKLAYQRPDDSTMLRVVEHDAELREVR